MMRWRLWDDQAVEPATVGVARDADMIVSVMNGSLPSMARLWTTQRAIVATEREGRRSGFTDAVRESEAEGWPVALRATGGSAFPVGPGVLNLSLAFPRDTLREPSINAAYRVLFTPILFALAEVGIDATMGRARDTFCEGGSDLLLDGRKIAGTAQTWRAGAARGGILAHAAILISGDMGESSRAIDRFYRRIGDAGALNPNAAVTVEEALGLTAKKWGDALMRRVRSAMKRAIENPYEARRPEKEAPTAIPA